MSSYRPEVIVTARLPPVDEGNRVGPPYSEMNCVAFSFQGGVSDTLGTAQLGGRTPQCMGLNGFVSPLFSRASAAQGVQISLPAGSYSVKAIGFYAAGVDCSGKSIASLFAGSPEVYQVGALASATVASGASLTVPFTYDAPSAVERVFDCAADTWRPMSLTNVPTARMGHTAIWTGSHMIVWGGSQLIGSVNLNTGAAYDPFENEWTPLTTAGAPAPRAHHSAVWTGSKMIVWGGVDGLTEFDTGGMYDPTNGTWSETDTNDAPLPRDSHRAVWTGTEMLMWGGKNGGSYVIPGGHFDPSAGPNGTWSPMGATAIPSRHLFPMVWTGSHMLFWGGHNTGALSTGGLYEPVGRVWGVVSPIDAPSARYEHGGVWTGSHLLIWGANDEPYGMDGHSFNSTNNSWSPLSKVGQPDYRQQFSTTWTGSKMIVFGGSDYSSGYPVNSGFAYNLANDSWSPISQTNVTEHSGHTAVWTGTKLIVWGGQSYLNDPQQGAVYSP